MKRLRQLLWLPLLFLLVACGGTSAKETFISRLEANQSAKQAAYEFTFTLEEAETDQVGYNPLSGFVGQDITLYITQDMDNNLVSVSADLSAFSPTLSQVEMIYADDKAYMSAVPILAMSGGSAADYQGKYIDLEATSGQGLPALSSFSPADYQNVDSYRELDDNKFKRKGDDVTLSLTLEDMVALVQKDFENIDKEAAAAFLEENENLSKTFANSKVDITIGKDGTGQARATVMASNSNKPQLIFNMTFKKVTYKAPTVPKASDILSEEALGQAMMSDVGASSKLSDSDFEAIYAGLETAVSEYTKEELQDMITALKPSLTNEQVARLEALLPKAKDNN